MFFLLHFLTLSNVPGELDLTLSELLDTFVDTSCWSKGFLIVNGKVVGRYWPEAGPQYTLYVPGNCMYYMASIIS